MRYYLQMLGVPSKLTSPCFMLFFDSKRYLFNAGENLQRCLLESKIRKSKITDVFLTGIHTEAIAALPSLMLNMIHDTKKGYRCKIHGPVGIAAFIEAACTFSWLDKFDVIEYGDRNISTHISRITTERTYKDENISVRIVSLNSFDEKWLEMPDGNKLRMPRESCASYFIECQPQPRKFRADKAKELGVPPGKLFGRLANGETLEINGRVITPDDVLDPATKPPAFGVIDVPSIQYLCPHISDVVCNYFTGELDFSALIHLSPTNVLLDPGYQTFLDMMPESTKNIVFNKHLTGNFKNTMQTPIFRSSDILLTELSGVSPKNFKLNTEMYKKVDPLLEENIKKNFKNLIIPQFKAKLNLSPPEMNGTIDETDCLNPLSQEEILKRVTDMEVPPFLTLNRISYEDFIDMSQPNSDPALLLLGTASMKPGKYRNVSGIWIGEFGSSLLFDCGEGTYGQLCRHFGEDINQALIDIKTIFISHLHADHHLGTIKLIHERSKLTDEPITIIAPYSYQIYLHICNELMGPLKFRFEPITNNHILPNFTSVQCIRVDHSIEAYGFAIQHQTGWKIVYSGDTRPCQALVEAGNNASLLIHEATFDDDLAEDASDKMHSTIGEALNIAVQMNAWKVVLTHFSQRYSKRPQNTQVDAVVGFDLMKIKLSESYEAVQNVNRLLKLFEETEKIEGEEEQA